MSLDGFAVLKSVAGHAELFSDARDAVDKAALNILAAQFKAKTFDLDRLKRACRILGADTLSLALDHFPDTLPKALIRRIDPHRPHDAGGGAWMRSHIVALASGAAKPEAKRKKPAKKKAGSVTDKTSQSQTTISLLRALGDICDGKAAACIEGAAAIQIGSHIV